MLVARVWGVGGSLLHAEVVKEGSRPKVGLGLRDQLGSKTVSIFFKCLLR
jgi:hypothetical protein